MLAMTHMRRLQAKAAALAVLDERFHAHAPAIATEVVPPGSFVGNDDEGNLFSCSPAGGQPDRSLIGFPQPHLPLPVLLS